MEIKFQAFTERDENGKTHLIIRKFHVPLTNENIEFKVEIPNNSEPLVYFTATTGMIETIGNMEDEEHATGYAFNNERHKFKVRNPFSLPKGERVYITEHLCLNGRPEYLATKHRISRGQNNFVNFGYIQNGNKVTQFIVDIITGESKWD